MVSPPDITALLGDWSRGDRAALNLLLPLVYAELRRAAARQLRRERADHTLQPTALVHEVYLRLVDQRQVDWQNRAHFFGVAAEVMKALLVRLGSPKDVDYKVSAGVVTLTGSVSSQARRSDIEKAAAAVPNVKQVVNELQVKNQKATGRGGN